MLILISTQFQSQSSEIKKSQIKQHVQVAIKDQQINFFQHTTTTSNTQDFSNMKGLSYKSNSCGKTRISDFNLRISLELNQDGETEFGTVTEV